jgi:hypothetical protein
VDRHRFGTHWHASRQSFTYRRPVAHITTNRKTFVHVTRELVYYRGTYRSVWTEDDSDTAKSIQCQLIGYQMPVHLQSSANPLPILCQSDVNPVPI